MRQRLARSAGLIGLATLSSRVLGLVREMVQGYFFATSDKADAFIVATRIPNLLRDLFAEGAMSAAFVPTLARYLQQGGREAAWRLGAQVINALLVVTGVLVLLGMVLAGPLARVYGAGYQDTPEKLDLTISLARINMPFLLLVAVAAACMGMLNALRRFLVPASSPAVFNVVFIASMAVCVPLFTRMGVDPVMALSVGMLLGGAGQVLIQWPALRAEGYRHRWRLSFRDPGLREVLILMGPGTLGVAAAQINLLVNTWLATHEDGAASALGYAFRLMYMPIGIIGVSVATAAIPELARQAADRAFDQMRSTLSWSLRLMLMMSVPASVGLMVLGTPIVEMLFQHGAWGTDSTRAVAGALLFYAPGIIGYSVVKIVSPGFYSLQDARTPSIVSLVTIAVNLALNLWLNSIMGFRGLALGTAIAANLNAALLVLLLSRRIGGVDGRRVTVSFVKILVASAVMGAAAWLVESGLRDVLSPATGLSEVMARVLRVGGAMGGGVAALTLAAWALRIEEFHQALRRVMARLRPNGTPS